jgi:hypothetical protein
MALQYGQSKAINEPDILLSLLRSCPSSHLLEMLLKTDGDEEGLKWGEGPGGPLLPLGVVLTTLTDVGHWDLGKTWLTNLVYGGRPKTGQCKN